MNTDGTVRILLSTIFCLSIAANAGACEFSFIAEEFSQFRGALDSVRPIGGYETWGDRLLRASKSWTTEITHIKTWREVRGIGEVDAPFAAYTDQGPTREMKRMQMHAATILIGATSNIEIDMMVAMVYNLHLIDDLVDPIKLTPGNYEFFHQIAREPSRVKDLLFSQDSRPLSEDEGKSVYTLRLLASHLRTMLLRRFIFEGIQARSMPKIDTTVNIEKALSDRFEGLADSFFLLAYSSTMAEKLRPSFGARFNVDEVVKAQLLVRLSPLLKPAFENFDPSVFRMPAKAPMAAIFALENQPYSHDRAFLWSLLFSPFFYDFSKPRHLNLTDFKAALTMAISLIARSHDQRLHLRIKQLEFMAKYWGVAVPTDILKIYRPLMHMQTPEALP